MKKRHLLISLIILAIIPAQGQVSVLNHNESAGKSQAAQMVGRYHQKDVKAVLPENKKMRIPGLAEATQANKQRLDSIVNRNWVTGSNVWKGDTKEEFVYNAGGRQTTYISYSWDDATGRWAGDLKMDYTFNAKGQVSMTTMYEMDSITHQWVGAVKQEVTYNDKSYQTVSISSEWDKDAGSWVPGFKYESAYDDKGSMTDNVLSMWDTNQWLVFSKDKTAYTYDNAGNTTVQVHSEWSMFTNTWTNSDKNEYTYNAGGMVTTETNSKWDPMTSQWLLDTKTEYTYNAGRPDTEISYKRNPANTAWVADTKDEYSFDANGNMTMDAAYTWNATSSQWVNDWKDEYAYDLAYTHSDIIFPEMFNIAFNSEFMPNKLLVNKSMKWTNNSWVDDSKTTYYYSNANVTNVPSATMETVRIFPNPVSEYLSFSLPGDQGLITFELFDLQGRKLMSADLNHSDRINMQGISSGVYLYTITMGEKKQTGKLLKE